MKVRFIYARFERHADSNPQLLEFVPANEYFGGPSLGIAMLAAMTPPHWQVDFRDDRIEDIGADDDLDLVAISCFTPSAKRAMQIGDVFRGRGVKVVTGGVFPTMMPQEMAPHADAVVRGEGEGVWQRVLADAEAGRLQQLYDARVDPVDPEKLPAPKIDLYIDKEAGRYRPDDYPIQISRGCPLQCSACVIPEWMGKKIRHIPVPQVMQQIDQLAEKGKRACFTEDTSFFFGSGTQKHFAKVVDALIAEGRQASVSYIGISMPLVLITKESFLKRIREAGIDMFYLVGGFDPITQGAFTGKDPKSLKRATEAVNKAHANGIEPYTSFLIGNDNDDEGCFDRILEFANATKIRKAEFAIRTPYPGTPSWYELSQANRILHQDWSKYNDANVVFRPKLMTPEALYEGYLYLWRELYRTRGELRDASYRERTIQF
ncbi:MAG: B12-binding domain-containing radical SAM protein [Deltaproteobacteria bacterium]|nr:B12-binding domain-containing radical SAM protein [Deltaproteobacteria bacterium]